MSTTVDERVVEMRFDNKQFESNVNTSMSTLDKLKQKLNLTGATKGLEEVDAAAKKVNFSGLNGAVDTVQNKFSALEVMAVTALANITNSAVNAGKRIVSSLTIDPIKTGFAEYETQINAVQTILANTQSKGTTLDDVNAALDELNTYADKTIYNFTEMTKNIGTFTAAGVDLDTSVAAIKGIANLAAVSGSTSQQASTAMYQLSQALAAGKVTLMDWNSVVNAGMGGQVFQDALKETAKAHGTDVEAMIETYGSFRETLTKEGWLTNEILTETLAKFTGDLSEEQLKSMGYTEEQIESIVKMGQTANDAATKVKTFTQLFDTLKEAAQSGWTQTWEIIVGDFEEAKELLTEVSDGFGAVINESSKARNDLLEGALSANGLDKSAWLEFSTNAGEATSAFQEALKKTAKDHGVAIDEIIEANGSFEDSLKEGWLTADIISETIKKFSGNIDNLSDSELKAAGYTDEQIEALRELGKQAEETGTPLSKLISDIERPSGRELIIDTFRNALKGLAKVINSVSKAWREIFPATTSEQLYAIIVKIHDLSAGLKTSDETADKVRRTFKGLFAVLDIVTTLIGGPIKIALKLLGKVLGSVDLDILSVTASVGDAIVKFRDWLFSNNKVVKALGKFVGVLGKGVDTLKVWADAHKDAIKNGATKFVNALKTGLGTIKKWGTTIANASKKAVVAIKNWITSFTELPVVQENIQRFSSAFGKTFTNLKEYFSGGIERIKEFIARVKSMDSITLDNIGDVFKDFKDNVLGYFTNVGGKFDDLKLAIKEFVDDVKGRFTAFKDNVVGSFEKVGTTIDDVKTKIINFVSIVKDKLSDNTGAILAIGTGAGLFLGIKKLSDIIDHLLGPFDEVVGLFDDFRKGFNKLASAKSFQMTSEGILNIAKALAILALSIMVLTFVDQGKLWSSVGAIAVLAVVLVGLTAAMKALNKIDKGGVSTSVSIIAVAAAVLILVMALKKMEKLSGDNLLRNIAILGALAVALGVAVGIMGKLAPQLSKGALVILAFAIALRILVGALEKLEKINSNDISDSLSVLLVLMGSLALVMQTCKSVGAGSAISVLAAVLALNILVGVVKKIAKLDTDLMENNIGAFIAIFGMFALLMASSHLAGTNATKAGVAILAMSVALVVIIQAIKMIAEINPADLTKGLLTITTLMTLFAAIIAVSYFAGENATKAGVMLLLMSAAILILSGVIVILTQLDPSGLGRALSAIIAIGLVFAAIIAVTALAKDCKSTLIVLAAALVALAVAIGVLTLVDQDNLKNATVCISAIMAVFALLIASTQTAKKATSTLVTMTVAVVALGAILYLLASMDSENVLSSAIGLSALILSLTASLKIISGVKSVSVKALAALGVMTLIVAGLAIIVGSLSIVRTDIESSLGTASAISLLLISMSAALLILDNVGSISPSALASLTIMTVIVGLLAAILGVLASFDVGPTLEIATSLSLLLTSLSGACLILTAVGLAGPAALIGIASLSALIVAVGGLMIAIGALCEYFPGMESFLDKGLDLLSKIGYGLGDFVGSIIGGLLDGITSGLPGIGQNLSDFLTKAQPFFDGIKNIDNEAITGVKNLVTTILLLTAADLLNSVVGWITGGSSLSSFAEELIPFGKAFAEYAELIKDVDPDVVMATSNAAKSLASFASEIPNQGGIVSWFTGDNTLADFAEGLVPFGENFAKYADTIKDINPEAVMATSYAAKSIAEFASELPNQGGVVSWFTGDNTLSDFAEELAAFGPKLKEYADSVKGLSVEAVTNSTTAAKSISEMAKNLPNQGGIVSWFTGDNTLSQFAEELAAFGPEIKKYADSVAGLSVEAVVNSTTAAKSISEMAENLPNQGGMVSWFTGDNTLAVFGAELAKFGPDLKSYADSVEGLDTGVIDNSINAAKALSELEANLPNKGGLMGWFTGDNDLATFGTNLIVFGRNFAEYSRTMDDVDSDVLTTTTNAAKSIVELSNNLPKDGGWFSDDTTLKEFGEDMSSFGKEFKNYYNNVSDVDPAVLGGVITQTNKLVSMAKGMVDLDTSAMSSFGKGLKKLGEAGIDDFIKAFTNAESRVKTAGANMVLKVESGAKEKKEVLKTAFATIVGDAVKAIEAKYSDFTSAGKKSMTKFGDGAKEKTDSIKSTITNIISAALTAIKDKYDKFKEYGEKVMSKFIAGITSKDNSTPKDKFSSSVGEALAIIRSEYENFKSAGSYLVDGFAAGISANSYKAAAKATAMASAAASAARKELDEHSPSRVFYEIGNYAGVAFVNALGDCVSGSYDAGSEMAESAKEGLGKAISKIVDVINSDMDTQPTIRPVLDLSDVESKTSRLNTMFGRTRAMEVSASINQARAEERQNGNDISSNGANYSFVQNNYSPKALSKLEIYRQTKNQFSAMKKAVEK